jgi:hypothetical protein
MKLIKMLGLAALAAMVAMAFVGVSSASAEGSVVLCKNAELVCEAPYPNPTTIVGHAENPKLLSSIGTVECEKSLAELTLLNELAKLMKGHILSLKFEGNCHLGGTSCTVTVGQVGGLSILHGADPLKWHAIAIELEGKSTEATVKCGFFINCTYIGGEETKVTSTNNEAGEVTLVAEKAELKKSKGICPSVSEWDATYVGLGTGLWLES